MTGFWALARKELLEQRRSWRFMALVGVFTTLALLTTIIPFIVFVVRDMDRGLDDARQVLLAFGFVSVGLGTLLAIIVSMGSLAGERASGTAAMTLSKPVTRFAFVSAKFLGIVVSIFAALAIASIIKYVLTLFMFDDGGLLGFARFMGIIGVYLVFIGSIAFFWSGMFNRHLLAGGIALVLFIAFIPLSEIPHTQRYWPLNTVEWAESNFAELHEPSPIDEVIVPLGSASGVRGREGRRSVAAPVIVEGGPIDRSPITLQRFEQLRLELADIKDIDGLAARIIGGESVENPESRRRGHVMVIGLDPRYLEGFGVLTFSSGGEARLEDLADDQVYISKDAAREMDAEAGDRLLLGQFIREGFTKLPSDGREEKISEAVVSPDEAVSVDEEVSVNVRGVVKPGALANFGPTIIMPLQRAQTMMRLDDQISEILVSNRGGEDSGSGLSKEVTRNLRVRFADREAASQLKELLGQETVLKALKRMEKDLDGGNVREDLSRLREELQREGTSDEFISLLAEPEVPIFVMQALDRDGLDDVLQGARPLFANQAEFRVLDLNRRPFNWASDYWSAFAITFGSIALLSVGAWRVFRRKEL